jgi:ABC-type sugar transport system substrate-binding protein
VANANGDAVKQITDFHNLIAEGAQGIITVPTDSDAIVPPLNYAAESTCRSSRSTSGRLATRPT